MKSLALKIVLSVVSLLLVLAVVAFVAWWRLLPPAVERQLFVNGTVLTMDNTNRVASAIAIEGDRIVAVGDSDALKQQYGSGAEVHDLVGKTLIPGFVDAHGHFPASGLSILGVDLGSPPIGDLTSLSQLQERLKQKAANTPKGQWIFGFGYDDTLMAEKRFPTRQELDAVSKDHPVFIWHISGHMGVTNSRGLELAQIGPGTEDPPGGVIVRDGKGEMTGLLQESAHVIVLRLALNPSVFDFVRMVRYASAEYAAQGVTTAQNGATDGKSLKGLSLASWLHLIPMRLEVWPTWDELGRQLLDGKVQRGDFETDRFHIGAIKFFTDGSIQGYTGLLSRPYHVPYHGDKEYRGFPTIEQDKLVEWLGRYHAAGFQVALHCNGDAAIDNVLDAIEAAQKANPRPDIRHILVHAQMSRRDQIGRMKALGATPSFFSAHTYYWGDRHRDVFMGPDRAANMSPTRWAEDAGLRFSSHLDTPVVPMNPRMLWWSMVNRVSSSGRPIGPEQRLNVLEALRALTSDAAWQLHREDSVGSLEPGKFADIVVLNEDPRKIHDLRELQIERTMVGGTTIYQRSRGRGQ